MNRILSYQKVINLVLLTISLTLASPLLAQTQHRHKHHRRHPIHHRRHHARHHQHGRKHHRRRKHHHASPHYLPLPRSPLSVTGFAPEEAKHFDKQFQRLMRIWRIPGGAVLVMKNHRVLFARGYGYSDLQSKKPMQPDALFRIGSISKLVTAITSLWLVQHHYLNLNTRVYPMLGLQTLQHRSPARLVNTITVKNLLQMSSGWYTNKVSDLDPMFGPWPKRVKRMLDWQIPPSCKMAARLMKSQRLSFFPGKDYSYSNINYCLLGLVIKRIARNQSALPMSYEAFVKQNILLPAGITDMQIGSTDHARRAEGEVTYYNYPLHRMQHQKSNLDGLPYSYTDLLRKNDADGGWIASTKDLALLMSALGERRILNRHMLQLMTERPSFQKKPGHYFSMGMAVKFKHNRTYWVKTGSFTGTIALVIRRDDGLVSAALFNTQPTLKWRFFKRVQSLLEKSFV